MKDEDIIRLEYKLDLIIRALQSNNLMLTDLPSMAGIEEDTCPVCNTNIKLVVNPAEGSLTRKCECELPKKAYKLTIITQTKEAENAHNRTSEIEVSSDRQE